jgi:ABC-type glycerol-3-phosphate transport system substrate-binding protein
MRSIVTRYVLIVLTLATLMLVGCGENEQPVPELEPVTLHFGVPFPAADTPPPMMEAIEHFQQEHAHVTVEIVGTFYLSGFVGTEEKPLDAYLSLPYFDPRGTAEDQFAALSLEPFISADTEGFNEEDFFPLLLDALRWDGQLYALPAGADVAVLYYNRDMFDTQAVAYPGADWDWQDLLSTAQQLTTLAGDDQNQTGHWGLVCDPAVSYLFVLQNSGMIFDDLLQPTRPILNDPRVPEALRWYADLALVYGVMPTPDKLERIPLDTHGAFATGKAAMWIDGFGSRGGEADRIPWRFAWGTAPLPHGKTGANWVFPLGYFIAAQADHPQEAWTLIRSLSEAASLYVPARRELAESDAFRQRVGPEVADAALRALDSESLVLVPAAAVGISGGPRLNEFWTLFIDSATDLANGDITAERMVGRLQERFAGQSFEEP